MPDDDEVSRFVTFAVAWIVAAALALGVAWKGVGIVGENVTERRPAPLTAREVRERASAGQASSAPPSTVAPVTPSDAQSPPSTVTTMSPSPTVTGGAAATTTTTTTRVPAPASTSETRTYNLVGGSVALRFSPSGVSVLWANPNPGFSVEVEPEESNGVRVEFESDSHRSRLEGWWEAAPRDRVREEGRGEDSGEGDSSGSDSSGSDSSGSGSS